MIVELSLDAEYCEYECPFCGEKNKMVLNDIRKRKNFNFNCEKCNKTIHCIYVNEGTEDIFHFEPND